MNQTQPLHTWLATQEDDTPMHLLRRRDAGGVWRPSDPTRPPAPPRRRVGRLPRRSATPRQDCIDALVLVQQAGRLLRGAGASRALHRIRSAIASIRGAIRVADMRPTTPTTPTKATR